MIYFSGDTHGHIDIDKLLYPPHPFTREDIIIILGDCGVLFLSDKESIAESISLYESIGATILYIDGNHENFPLISSYPIVERYGAKMNQISEHVYHVCRGEIMEIEGYSFFCMGGACSTDRHLRTEGLSWWPQEVISDSDLQHGLDNLAKYNNKVDFVLTHCMESSKHFFAFHLRPDACSSKLDIIESKVSYRLWLCGHYHVDHYLAGNKVCLYERLGYLNPKSDILFSYVE